jgi:hypothetical protein
VQGFFVDKKSEKPKKGGERKVSDRSFRSFSALYGLFWGVYSLRQFSKNMPIFGGVYVE